MKRREFMAKSALSAVGVTQFGRSLARSDFRVLDSGENKALNEKVGSAAADWEVKAPSNQKMNLDYISYLPGVEYFLLGNGDIQGVVQYCKDHKLAGDSSFFGLTLIDPERLTQKWSTLLYRPSVGFGSTGMLVGVDGKSYGVNADNFIAINWEHVDAVPLVRMRWTAGVCEVEEEFFVPRSGSMLFRRGKVKNLDSSPHGVVTGLTLYPNIALFDDIYTDAKTATANAEGFTRLQLLSLEQNAKAVGRYDVRVNAGALAPGKETSAAYAYRLGHDEKPLKKKGFISLWSATSAYWKEKNRVSTGNDNLDHIWEIARTGMRAHVARNGKRDGGMWEYAMEWAGDDIFALMAALMAGFYDEAKILLLRTLDKLVVDDGRTVESSQVFDFQFTEINQNGMILYGVWTYVAWTGDYSTVRKRWQKLKALAELPLRPYFWDKKSGLLSNSREFWERSSSFGVKPGFELAYQFWVVLGLEHISQVASTLGHAAEAKRWLDAASSIKNSFLHDKNFRLIEDGHLIKRRTLDGEWQRTFIPPDRAAMPEGTPIAMEKEPLVEPDASEVFPIIFEMIDPKSDLSLKTLEWVESLWNQRWKIGGYERYNSSSEPQPPGPWPIASLLIAEAYWEAGNYDKGMRVVNWLNEISGRISGGWFEYYPEGHPSVGIIAWAWVECVRLTVDHMLGIRPQLEKLIVRPRLAPGMQEVKAKIRVRDTQLELNVKSGSAGRWAMVNSRRVDMPDGVLTIPYSGVSKLRIEINLPTVE